MLEHYIEQHKERLNYMPWLFYSLKAKHLEWAIPWQQEWQAHLMAMEDIKIGNHCFISPLARLFAEPGRTITIGDHSFIGAHAFLHGPITIGSHVGINHHCSLDGGRAGIVIGNHCRIAAHCTFYAFNHGMAANKLVHQQTVTSQGIHLGNDIWVGAQTGIVDGVTLEDGCIVGMNSQVTKSFTKAQKIAGNPAKRIGER